MFSTYATIAAMSLNISVSRKFISLGKAWSYRGHKQHFVGQCIGLKI